LYFKTIVLTTFLAMPALAQERLPSTEQAVLEKQNSYCLTLFESYELEKAINYCLTEANRGDIQAAEILARIYSTKGNMLNYAKAFEWALISSERGSLNSQALLGLLYLRGDGTEKNTDKAQHYIQLAINNGNKGAIKLRKLMKRAGLWRKRT